MKSFRMTKDTLPHQNDYRSLKEFNKRAQQQNTC